MKKIIFGIITLLAGLSLIGCSGKNAYKEKMQEWFDDSKNQAEILKNDAKCDILVGLIDKDSKVVSNEVLDITENETLYSVFQKNVDKYVLQGSDSEYGFYLTGINEITSDYSKDGSYISLWINGDYAQYGISDLMLHDNDVVACVYMVGY